MFEWTFILPLAAQAFFAVATIEVLRRCVFARLNQLPQPALVRDVWSPLIVILPMMFLAGKVDGSVQGVGWIAIGGPVLCCIFALAVALIVARDRFMADGFTVAMWSLAGLVLLLLGAAHHLNVLVAQCTFAIAALLLWLNTPSDSVEPTARQNQWRTGVGVFIAVICSAGHGVAAVCAHDGSMAISGALMIATAAMIIACAAGLSGGEVAIRLGGWAATYGLLAGVGMISLVRLTPEVYHRLMGDQPPRMIYRVAYGFGAFWMEALALLTFGAASAWLMRQGSLVRRLIGSALLLGGAVLAAWRLSAI